MTDLETLELRAASARAKRQAFPTAARIGDELRQHFPGARVTYASEDGREFGTPGDEGAIATQVLRAKK